MNNHDFVDWVINAAPREDLERFLFKHIESLKAHFDPTLAITYHNSFGDLLVQEFGLSPFDEEESQSWDVDQAGACVPSYINGSRYWNAEEDVIELEYDDELDVAWRFTEEDYDENDYIIIRTKADRFRLATDNEFRRFMGGD